MDTIEREMSAASHRIVRLYASSKGNLLDDPIAIRPNMHCGMGGG